MGKGKRKNRRHSIKQIDDRLTITENLHGEIPPTVASSEQMTEATHKQYLELRKDYLDRSSDIPKEFDKTIITLSAGSFALSLAFLKDIIPLSKAIGSWLVPLSWLFFCGAILLTLINMLVVQHIYEKYVDILDSECEKQRDDFLIQVRKEQTNYSYIKWIWWINQKSMACFVSGIIAMVLFGFINLTCHNGEPNDSKARHTATQPIETKK